MYYVTRKFDFLCNQLKNAINLYTSQNLVLWTIFSIFWAANAILLGALFTTGKFPRNPMVGVIISSVGVVMSLVWKIMQGRALKHINFYEHIIHNIEITLSIDKKFRVSPLEDDETYNKYLSSGTKAREIIPYCSVGAAIAWGLSLGFFIVKFLLFYCCMHY